MDAVLGVLQDFIGDGSKSALLFIALAAVAAR